MTTQIGNKTLSIFEQGPESHKLFVEFQVDGDIHKGQPVVLHSDGDKVTAASASSTADQIIGISIHNGYSAYGDNVVIAMKAFAVINCKAAETFTPGPVVYNGFDTTDAYPGTQKEFEGYNLVGNIAGNNVAQVETVTLTGTGGTANVTMGGLTKVATFDTNLADTHAAFVAAHAAAYALVGITLTGTTTLIFTAAVAGTSFIAGVVENLTDDLAGTVAHTTPNQVAGASANRFGWALDAGTVGVIVRVAVSA